MPPDPQKDNNFLTFNIPHRLINDCVYNKIKFSQILKNFPQHFL
jgi:hypothetical protein